VTHPPPGVPFPAGGPVLAATDLREPGDDAIRQADALARDYRLPLVVCHVLPELLGTRVLLPQLRQADHAATADLERRVGDVLAERVETLTGRAAGDYRLALASGSAHSVVVEQADAAGAALVVVGAGPEAPRVVQHAHCAALVARPAPRAPCSPRQPRRGRRRQLPQVQAARPARARRPAVGGPRQGDELYPDHEPFYPHDSRLHVVYDLAEEFDVPVMIRCGDTYEARGRLKYAHSLEVDEVAVDHPNVKLVICHLENHWLVDCMEVLHKNKNVYADFSGLMLGDFTEAFED
jgi:nucleotide-binding universal stress UspA family protein